MEKCRVCLGEVPLMRCEALDVKERFTETGECRFCSGRWLPSRFHLLPSHTHTHTHLLSTHFPFPLTLLHPYKGLYICAHKHKLFPFHCNMNRHVHTASHLDVTALPGLLFAILKTPLLSLSKLQADGDESAWRSLGSCESCFFFSLSVYLETILRTPLAARRGNLSSTAWHISVRVQGFLLLHTTLLRSLRGGIFVRICALKHVINNPVCSKWMTRPSVAAISWTATSLSLSSALEGWNLSKLMKYWRHSL